MSDYPQQFVDSSTLQSKNLTIVVSIEGLDDILSLGTIYTGAKYGDSSLYYGLSGLFYGAQAQVQNSLNQFLTLEGSLSISQKLEIEQGRSSVSQMSLVFIDKDSYFTKLCSPGIVIDDILGGKEVRIYMGYQNNSYPEDFLIIFRGIITGIVFQNEKVTISLSDTNYKRKQNVFETDKLGTDRFVDISDTSIYVSTSNYYKKIFNPLTFSLVQSLFDINVKNFIRIEDEFIEYQSTLFDISVLSDRFTQIVRSSSNYPTGYLTNSITAHDTGIPVEGVIEIGPHHVIDIALMIMLSGWDGPCVLDIECDYVLKKNIPYDNGTIAFKTGVDLKKTYGLTIGDYVVMPGFLPSEGLGVIKEFQIGDDGTSNNKIILEYINTTDEISLSIDSDEVPSSQKFSFRSQFDVLPIQAGLKLKMNDVDVDMHLYIKNIFLTSSIYNGKFSMKEKQVGKDFIESELYFPFGLYSLTRFGRCSVGYTRPPISPSSLITLSADNIIDPNSITLTRSMNNRRFYNQITYDYDKLYENEFYQSRLITSNLDSSSLFGKDENLLIESTAIRKNLGGDDVVLKISNALLNRFSNIAYEISLKTNFAAGSLIEVGDIVILKDDGQLKIPNFSTGERDLKQTPFEVVERNLDIKSGTTSLKLLSGIVNNLTDKYGSISPSSIILVGSSLDSLKFSSNDLIKWQDHVGQKALLHNSSWSYQLETTILALTDSEMIISDELGFDPTGYILDIPFYPTSTDKNEQCLYKKIYCRLGPLVYCSSVGTTTTIITDILYYPWFFEGMIIRVRKDDFSLISNEVKITNITIGIADFTCDLSSSIGFVSGLDSVIELVGFEDHDGCYRFV